MLEKGRKLSREEMESARRWILAETGLDAGCYKEEFLGRRFLPRAQSLGFRNLVPYFESLRDDPRERAAARKRLFVGTTELFRNREVFSSLDHFLERSACELGWKRILAVSAPCSTGEEALSLAMTLAGRPRPFVVLAIDRNTGPLRSLRSQKFQEKSLHKLDKKERKLYLNNDGNLFSFKEELLDAIVPVCCDLTRQLPARGAHVVMMRNFFIYLTETAQRAAVERAREALAPGGFLVTGKVERPRLDASEWERCDTESKIFRLKRGIK